MLPKLLCIAALICLARGFDDDDVEDSVSDDDVVVLTKENFANVIGETKHLLIAFIDPENESCQMLAPEFAAAASVLKEDDIVLAKVDCPNESPVCEEMNINQYPVILYFKSGDPTNYAGKGGLRGDLVDYMVKQAKPKPKTVDDADALEAFLETRPVAVVAHLTKKDALSRAFHAAYAARPAGVSFLLAGSEAVGVKEGTVEVFRSFDEPRVLYTGEPKVTALLAFIKGLSTPTVMAFQEHERAIALHENLQRFYLFAEDMDAVSKDFEDAAKARVAKDVLFIQVSQRTESGRRLAESVGLKQDKDFPALMGIFPMAAPRVGAVMQPMKFPYNGTTADADEQVISKFVDDVLGNRVTRTMYTSNQPAQRVKQGITTLTGKTMNEVMDETKDVLLMLDAPDNLCPVCSELRTLVRGVAAATAASPSLVIARVDTSENDVHVPEPKLFPNVILFPADSKLTPVQYEFGGKPPTVETITEWLTEHASKPVTLGSAKSEL